MKFILLVSGSVRRFIYEDGDQYPLRQAMSVSDLLHSNFFTSPPVAKSVLKELQSGCDCEDKTVATPGNRPGPPLSRQPYY